MKRVAVSCVIVWIAATGCAGWGVEGAETHGTSQPAPVGNPSSRPFWNGHALRFIDAPAFEFGKLDGAEKYRFSVQARDGRVHTFTASDPTAALTPVWDNVAEGYTTLTVRGLDQAGRDLGVAGERVFYRSPGFSGDAGSPLRPYDDAGRWALKAIFQAPHVQTWSNSAIPDRAYARYCYPNKVIGGLIRAMTAYARVADSENDRAAALAIAKRAADYLISIRLAEPSPYANVPPTYANNVDRPTRVTLERVDAHWLMVPSTVDAAFGFLDLYDACRDEEYLQAARAVAETLLRTQETDGTWPLMVDDRTGKPVAPQRLIPTWVILLFDRLDQQYQLTFCRNARQRSWAWIVANPLKTYQWDAQFEDIRLHEPYVNLAREQACDVAMLLMSDSAGRKPTAQDVAQAEELLRFAEDQFVVWAPVTDVAGWKKAMPQRRKNCEAWITPCVLEQYACYDPVARSSAILINAYIRAHQMTNKPQYLAKARALANGMLAGQAWLAQAHHGNGEIPTWNMQRPPINWLNNSYYAADAVLNLGRYVANQQPRER